MGLVANIYNDYYTEKHFRDIRKNNRNKAILFKLVAYMIMEELDRRGKGYNDEHI